MFCWHVDLRVDLWSFNLDIAERIKLVRGDLSQDEFSKRLEIHKNSLGRYERGESTPGVDVAEKICSVFGVNPQWFLLGVGSMKVEGIAPSPNLQQADGVDELKNRIAELEADNRRLEVELLAEKKITSVYQETLEALKAFALKGGAGITDVPVSVPSAPSINLTSDE